MYNILICDDDRDIVEALKIYLSGEDYRLFAAYNGQEALDVVRQREIHCILMDVMMPKMDGLAATRAIRALDRSDAASIPIIAMTGNAFQEDVRECLEAGMNAHMAKPIDLAKAERVIAAAMNGGPDSVRQ